MAGYQRRDFLVGGAAFAAAAAALGVSAGRNEVAQGGDPSFMNNVPDPVTSGAELPTFKFALEKSKGRVMRNSYGKEATVTQLPISKGLAGVAMVLEPGAMREMHWHATAAEWAFVVSGRVRTTLVEPSGRAETNDFEPGDVWYFPRGHGHMLECLGDEPTHFILIFDNGYFSEFGTFSVSDWLGHTPRELLAKNFGVPASTFDDFPKEEVYFAFGRKPPIPADSPLQGLNPSTLTHRYQLLAQPPHRTFKGGREWRADSSRFPISKTITGMIVDLEPGAIRELHWHPNADEWHYVVSGNINVTMFASNGRFRTESLEAGDVGYIPQGYGHSIENTGDAPCRVLLAFNAGTYESIDLSQWIAANPVDVLSTNLGQPTSVFEKFPKRDVFIAPSENAAN